MLGLVFEDLSVTYITVFLLLAGVILLSAFVVAVLIINIRYYISEKSRLLNEMEQMKAADNALLLYVLARELANNLMQQDSSDYLKRFEKLYWKWVDIKKKTREYKFAHLQVITSKYPLYSDFESLNIKPYILYSEGFSYQSYDEWWDLYEAIRLFDALKCDLDKEWKFHGNDISKKELEHLQEYCRKFDDTKLLAHLHKAREQLELLRNNNVDALVNSDWQYDTQDYQFKRVPHVCEFRWGVYVKKLDRYGMWGVFDDGQTSYTTFFAADKKFEEVLLDPLHMPISIDAKKYDRLETVEW